MLDFSTRELIKHAGTDDFDYIVVTWNPSDEVQAWLDERFGKVIQVVYQADESLQYVPNLRMMFNKGFDAGYELNDYVCIVNTDMAFGTDWLKNLVDRTEPDVIPNSLHISPIKGPNIVTADCGVPTAEAFDAVKFWNLHDDLFQHRVDTEEGRGGWEATQTLPYIIHRKWWEKCGPWEPFVRKDQPPDRMFFERVHKAGARYILCHDSICYHHEAVERRSGKRPIGAENMPEGR